jgi:sugar phosphate isomerase/epimerase
MDRRRFLLASAAFTAALRAQEPKINFPSEPRQRLAVSTYAFQSVIKSPYLHSPDSANATLTLEKFAATIPSRFAVHGIEPWSQHFESTDPAYLRGLAASFEKAGVRVVNIPVDGAVRPCSDASDGRKLSREKWVDVAEILGSPAIRVHLTENAPEACVKDALFKLVDYAEHKNIVINLENLNSKWDEAVRIMNVIVEVNSPFLRALPDFCNSQLVGDEVYAERALKLMFLYAYNISHVKDEKTADGKTYRVDMPRVFDIAKKFGYRGYFSMEWEGKGDPYEGTKRLIKTTLENLS